MPMMRRITVLSEHTVTVLTDGREEKRLYAPAGALFLQLLKGNGHSLVCCNGKMCIRDRIQPGESDQRRQNESRDPDFTVVSENGRGGRKGSISMHGRK